MPVIKINGQQFVLQPGPNRLGGGTTADVVIGTADVIQAVVDLGADGRATIRKNSDANTIRVNGMALGGPTPLIHGDKVEIAGHELFFADDAKVGATQFVSASDVAAIAAAKRSGPARATASSGGRLVSLVDGKEYAVPEAGITIGRDASAEIVVAQTSVSRRHAQVIASANGYVVNDLSTNGLFVNGEKVNGSQPLSRADVIRVGTEEFRFYADVAPVAKAAAPAAPAAPAPAAVKPTPTPASPPTPPQRPATPPPPPSVVSAVPTAPRPATPPPTPPAAKAPPAPTPAPKPAAAPPPPPPVKAPPHVAPAPAAVAKDAAEAQREPVTMKKGVPLWAGLLVIIAVAAIAAYIIILR